MSAKVWDRDAERAVLGAILINEDECWAEGVHVALAPEDFGVPIHVPIYRAMLSLRAKRIPIGVLTVRDELESVGAIAIVDAETAPLYTEGFLVSLWEATYYSHGVRGPLYIVKSWASKRQTFRRAEKMVRDAQATKPMRGWL